MEHYNPSSSPAKAGHYGAGIGTLENKTRKPKSQKERMMKIFKQMGLNPKARAQELSVEKWIELVNWVIG